MSKVKILKAFTNDTPLTLSSGKTLSNIDIAYETFGTLNKRKNNAILVCHALTGDSHAHGPNKSKAGWWDTLIGPGKAIDTKKYFVICSNVLGSCYGTTGPTSIDPKTNKPYGLNFPVITIKDMVQVQNALIEALDIRKLKLVIGGSMGGMQAMEWAITYPNKMEKVAIIAAADQLTPQSLAFNSIGRESIVTDPDWKKGKYTEETPPKTGLSIARMMGHITYRSNESIAKRFGRKLQKKADYTYDFSTNFEIESYLKYQGDKFVNRFDANTYLYLSKAMSYFDLNKQYKNLDKAFAPCSAQFLVVSISSDWLYPPHQSKKIAYTLMHLKKSVTYSLIDAPHGHDSFLMDVPDLSAIVSAFIKREKS